MFVECYQLKFISEPVETRRRIHPVTVDLELLTPGKYRLETNSYQLPVFFFFNFCFSLWGGLDFSILLFFSRFINFTKSS